MQRYAVETPYHVARLEYLRDLPRLQDGGNLGWPGAFPSTMRTHSSGQPVEIEIKFNAVNNTVGAGPPRGSRGFRL